MIRALAAMLVAAAVLLPWQAAPHAQRYFEASGDVGSPAIAGTTSYDARTQTYTMTGGGTNMWAERDEFQFAWRKLSGDFIVRAHVRFIGTGVDPHRKIGWIVRQSLDAGSPYADAAVHGDGLTSLQFRRTPGGVTEQIESAVKGADVVQLERRGKAFIMSVAKFGEPFTSSELSELDLGDAVHVGLFVCSHNPKVNEWAVFSKPASYATRSLRPGSRMR